MFVICLAARNRDLLSYDVSGGGRPVRTSSDDSLASHNHQRTNFLPPRAPAVEHATHDQLAQGSKGKYKTTV